MILDIIPKIYFQEFDIFKYFIYRFLSDISSIYSINMVKTLIVTQFLIVSDAFNNFPTLNFPILNNNNI